MTHDRYPGSSSNPRERELAAAREKLRDLHRAINYLKTRWYDYETMRRKGEDRSTELGEEIRARTADLQDDLGYIVVYIAPTLSAPGDLHLIELLKQEVEDSIDHLKML